MPAETADLLVVGGGVLGVSIARAWKRRRPADRVALLEKERDVGLHASGRNSGVLHAGFYYAADSLKARFCRDGNAAMADYCRTRGLRIDRSGKLVVATRPEELPALDVLLRRGRANGVRLEKVTEEDARRIEPRVLTTVHALWSPDTATVDPREVMRALGEDARREGIRILLRRPYVGRRGADLLAPGGPISAGHVVNAAGLQADRVARDYGFGQRYRILPFKGLTVVVEEPPGAFRVHVYPVPDLRFPFLGVHLGITVDRKARIGPTVMPALWREQYGLTGGFRPDELMDIAARALGLLFTPGFAPFALEEARKLSRRRLLELAARLVRGVTRLGPWAPPGIRAQLVDVRARKLVTDFVVEGDARSTHILNAVSPGFTSALPFAEHVCDLIEGGGPETRSSRLPTSEGRSRA